MAIEHSVIVDPERHEPKGIITATAKQVYVATGGGTDGGAWEDQIPVGASSAAVGQVFASNGLGGGAWKHRSNVHGEMLLQGNTTAVALSAAADTTLNTDSDYVRASSGIGTWQAGVLSFMNFSTDLLGIVVPGDYILNLWLELEVVNTSTRVAVKFAINDLVPYSTRKVSFQSNSVNNIGNLSGQFILPGLTALDTISLYVAADAATNIIVRDAGLILTLLHEA